MYINGRTFVGFETTETNYNESGEKPKYKENNKNQSYLTSMQGQMKEIRTLVNSNHKNKFYRNFIEIGGRTYNGVTKEILIKWGIIPHEY